MLRHERRQEDAAVDAANNDANKEKATVGDATIPTAAVEALVAAITSAITTAVATAVARVRPAPGTLATTAKKISTLINSYDTESMDLDSKEGKYH